jgi:hypothetical protein
VSGIFPHLSGKVGLVIGSEIFSGQTSACLLLNYRNTRSWSGDMALIEQLGTHIYPAVELLGLHQGFGVFRSSRRCSNK